jgi:hypothetical protein
MKNIYILLLALCCFTAVNAQKNYPILTFEEIGAATIVYDEVVMMVVENIGEIPNLAFYDLKKKELMQKFSAKLPENPVSHIIPCDNGLIYLLTIRRADDSGYPMFDAIYAFDYKKDKLQKIYTENDPIPMPSGASAVRTKLVLSGRAFHEQPRIFNVNTKEFEVLSDDESLRVLCTSDKHGSYVVIKFSELTEDDSFPIYVLDKDGKMSEQLGVYDSRMTASTNKEENHMPGFTITNANYNWIPEAFDNSGFPLSGFAIAMHPGLAEKYNKTDHLFDISEIVAANETYMAASGKGQFWVYNTKTPNTNKPKTVSDEDMAAINAYFNEKIEYIKTPVQSAALEQVFNAKFYSVTEKIKQGDYGFSESSFIAFAENNKYEVLMNKAMLTNLVAPEFKIENEQNAIVFQDALNALYPPGTFDIKHIQCYKKDNSWCFVRGESFGDKKGFVVRLNANNAIEKIEYSEKIN